MNDRVVSYADKHYEERIETLLSVDDLVESVIGALDVSVYKLNKIDTLY